MRGDLAALAAVHRRLAEELALRGFPREQRPFSPHLTLARLRAPLTDADARRLRLLLQESSAWEAAPIPVVRLSVMMSELGRPAARYTPLAVYPLGSIAQDTIH